TTICLNADTQSSGCLRSTCPNHLSLPRLTTTETHSISSRLNSSTLSFLSLSLTPHIHLIIILSVFFWSLHILCLHCPRLAAIYHYALNTSPINFSFQLQRSPPCREDRQEFPKLAPCTFYSHARGIFSAAA